MHGIDEESTIEEFWKIYVKNDDKNSKSISNLR